MAFRLVSSGGTVVDAAVVNMMASGTIHPGQPVEFSRTGGAGVNVASMNTTITQIFGVCLDYVQGASDVQVRVIPVNESQIWEADCMQAASTAQIGLRFGLSRTRDDNRVYNIATDSLTATAIFRCVAMSSGTSGSGKILGYFRRGSTTPGSLGAAFDTINF